MCDHVCCVFELCLWTVSIEAMCRVYCPSHVFVGKWTCYTSCMVRWMRDVCVRSVCVGGWVSIPVSGCMCVVYVICVRESCQSKLCVVYIAPRMFVWVCMSAIRRARYAGCVKGA